MEKIEQDRHISNGEISKELNVDHKTVLNHLKKTRRIQKENFIENVKKKLVSLLHWNTKLFFTRPNRLKNHSLPSQRIYPSCYVCISSSTNDTRYGRGCSVFRGSNSFLIIRFRPAATRQSVSHVALGAYCFNHGETFPKFESYESSYRRPSSRHGVIQPSYLLVFMFLVIELRQEGGGSRAKLQSTEREPNVNP